MRKTENACVHCDVCYGCGKKNNYEHIYCDICHSDIDEEEVREWDGKEVCEECYRDLFFKEYSGEMTFARALEIGEENEVEIKVNGFVYWVLGAKLFREISEQAAADGYKPDLLMEYCGDDYETIIPEKSFKEMLAEWRERTKKK